MVQLTANKGHSHISQAKWRLLLGQLVAQAQRHMLLAQVAHLFVLRRRLHKAISSLAGTVIFKLTDMVHDLGTHHAPLVYYLVAGSFELSSNEHG